MTRAQKRQAKRELKSNLLFLAWLVVLLFVVATISFLPTNGVETMGKTTVDTNKTRGNSPYHLKGKIPFHYSWQKRLANGDLQNKANQSPINKYR